MGKRYFSLQNIAIAFAAIVVTLGAIWSRDHFEAIQEEQAIQREQAFRASIDRIEVGMPLSEVLVILGYPPEPSSQGVLEWNEGRWLVQVFFDHDSERVAEKRVHDSRE